MESRGGQVRRHASFSSRDSEKTEQQAAVKRHASSKQRTETKTPTGFFLPKKVSQIVATSLNESPEKWKFYLLCLCSNLCSVTRQADSLSIVIVATPLPVDLLHAAKCAFCLRSGGFFC